MGRHDDGPDNAAGWDLLADPYQREVGWPSDDLSWGIAAPPESQVRIVSDVVPGATVLVVGCGGGQDMVALDRLGARHLIGVDPSQAQLDHARARLVGSGLDATLLRAGAESVPEVSTNTVDLVVAVQSLDYVEDLPACFAEVVRVLRPDGVLAFSVLHPADVSTDDQPPHGWHSSYFTEQRDWVWDGLTADEVPLRSWFRTPAAWFTAVRDAGLEVERLLEPPPADPTPWIRRGWLDATTAAKLETVPATILLRARLPRMEP